ncbi:hypothetical protein [Halopelagius fulvigenes]|uniref:Uncharacterized protein n=1 Tax=Halopelagius fulvigenes TaxID=1198324 RepID=A0ABD5TT39_9EURY
MGDWFFVSWEQINIASWLLLTIGGVSWRVVDWDFTRSFLRSFFYGDAYEGLNSIDRGGGIDRDDGSEFTDTMDILEEYGYLDDISKDRQAIVRARRSHNEILLFSEDEEYEVINRLDRLRPQVLTEMEGKVDHILRIIKHISTGAFFLGLVLQGLYLFRP